MNKVAALAVSAVSALVVAGCTTSQERASERSVIYKAKRVVTMAGRDVVGEAVAVRGGKIVGIGRLADLRNADADAIVDDTFAGKVIVPGLIDPHIHVVLGGLMYAQPFAPPWPMAMPGGMSRAYPTRAAFLARLREVVEATPADNSPIVIYGYHNLVQGAIDRSVLDRVTRERPLIVWHYSGHDFYLNTRALEYVGATPSLREKFHGVDLTPKGELTGRLYEDAGFYVFQRLASVLVSPEAVARGTQQYFAIMRRAGVTTTAELAYGAFGRQLEDKLITQTWSMEKNAFRLYLVPEHRAFVREFGEPAAPGAVRDMAAGHIKTPAPVLPRVKFFADGAYYSQTMRLSPPGYLQGQSKGSEGLWVIPHGEIAATMGPYLKAGLAAHIHSNGDAAQTATLDALREIRAAGLRPDVVIEHGGMFSPEQVVRAGTLNAMLSSASHYVHYMAYAYATPLGPKRARWIEPLRSLSEAGVAVALHSDAPLAPPQPLRAAGVQITRVTREQRPYEPSQGLTPYDALEAITLDAARVLGLEDEIGSISVGKRADFTILDADPLETPPAEWHQIGVWGVVLDGTKRPAA